MCDSGQASLQPNASMDHSSNKTWIHQYRGLIFYICSKFWEENLSLLIDLCPCIRMLFCFFKRDYNVFSPLRTLCLTFLIVEFNTDNGSLFVTYCQYLYFNSLLCQHVGIYRGAVRVHPAREWARNTVSVGPTDHWYTVPTLFSLTGKFLYQFVIRPSIHRVHLAFKAVGGNISVLLFYAVHTFWKKHEYPMLEGQQLINEQTGDSQ